MRKSFYFLFLVCQFGFSQPNCQIYQDSLCIKACEISNIAADYQGSKYSQELFDEAIKLCPGFAYAYFEKSVPYLKKGLFVEWKELIDQAVALDHNYLINRGSNQIQFIRNYQAGLDDLNQLYEIKKTFDIGYNPSGEYHGQLLRAIAFQKLGDANKAIEIIEELINQPTYAQGLFDYFHLGIAYLKVGDLDKAQNAFDMQNQENELGDTYFYYSQIFEQRNQIGEAIIKLENAVELYKTENSMFNVYYHYIDQIFSSDIENALKRLGK